MRPFTHLEAVVIFDRPDSKVRVRHWISDLRPWEYVLVDCYSSALSTHTDWYIRYRVAQVHSVMEVDDNTPYPASSSIVQRLEIEAHQMATALVSGGK